LPAILAEAENDGPPRLAQCFSHPLINRAQLRAWPDVQGGTPVVLEIVDSPFRPGACIDRLVPIAALEPGAAPGSGARVDPELQAPRMQVIRQRLHVGELRIGPQDTLRIAFPLPA